MNIVINMWTNDDDGALSKWFVSDGDEVREGDMIATVALEKTEFEVIAPANGRISIEVQEDGVVRPGDVIAKLI
ncbi:biotin/lipoyl-containing protein [Hyphococcus sp.]|uniref:biotin/lipoyl-containing protein n=1 Tax=Hyphococcus sp. TaxID=2038636 RepID=UPI003CCB9460